MAAHINKLLIVYAKRQEKEAYIKAKYVEKKFVDHSSQSALVARKKRLSERRKDNRLSSTDKSLSAEENARTPTRLLGN